MLEGAAPASSSSGALPWLTKLYRLVTCKRRRSPEEDVQSRTKSYNELLKLGRSVPENRKAWYEKLAFWSDVKTKMGNRIFVLAPRGPRGETEVHIDMWELLAFSLVLMHDSVVTEGASYSVVWVQLNNHRMWPWTMLNFAEYLHPKYGQLLEALHVVHPSWGCRILRLVLWPIADDELWDYFYAHERVEFLDTHMDMRKFRLPKDIYEYDKWLDQQAQEINEQAKKQFGGGSMFGASPGGFQLSEEDKRNHQMQMEELKRLLEQKGLGGKKEA